MRKGAARLLALVMAAALQAGTACSNLAVLPAGISCSAMAAETVWEGESESETQTEISLTLEDMDATVYAGTWVTIEEAGIELYLPGDWAMLEIGDEDEENGVLYAFADSVSSPYMQLVVSWAMAGQLGQIDSVEGLYEQFTSDGSGYRNAELGYINGIHVVTAQTEESDAGIAAFFDGWGNAFVLTFAPVADPDCQAYMADILCSMCSIM